MRKPGHRAATAVLLAERSRVVGVATEMLLTNAEPVSDDVARGITPQ
jgi:hypothetical protein